MRRAVLPVLLLLGATRVAFAQETNSPIPDREITQLSRDLYRVRDGTQHTVFLVGSEGIILADPLNLSTARWLRGELETRFPERRVRFVLHSHHHAERAEGAAVFNDTAEIVGHQNFNSALARSRRLMPQPYRYVRDVESEYSSRRTIVLGDGTVELISTGRFHSPDMTILYFPRERLVFAVDPPPVTEVPFSFRSISPRHVYEWLDTMASLDVDTVLVGTGETIVRAELTALREYLDALGTEFLRRYQEGYTLSELQAIQLSDPYVSSPHYGVRAAQVAALYRATRLVTAQMTLAAMANYEQRNPAGYCGAFTSCATGGAVPAGKVATAVLFGRRSGLVFELTLGAQSWNSRKARFFEDQVALRESRGALLFRYSPPRRGRFSYAVLGGISRTVGDVRGMDRVQEAVIPVGGRHVIAARDSKSGVTFGADVERVIGGGISLVVPIRITQVIGQLPQYWTTSTDVHAGIGVSVRVFRHIGYASGR